MDRRIGVGAAALNVVSVAVFGVSMLIPNTPLSYLSSMFIAFSFIALMSAFAAGAGEKRKSAGFAAVGFGAVYAALIILVYFAQLTTVANETLSAEARTLLDYSRMSLMFNYDLLGYAMMALATVFAGLSFKAEAKADKWLKALLIIHGVFFISCLVMPILGVFKYEGEASAGGVYALLFWCVYFIPVGVLSLLHFNKKETLQ